MADHADRIEKGFAAMLVLMFIVAVLLMIYVLLINAGAFVMKLVAGIVAVVFIAYVLGYIVTDMKDDIKSMRGDD